MPTPDDRNELAQLLMELEAELRNRRLWSARQPSPEALASRQPFAVDTLSFPEWLQFIFIPRLYQHIEAELAMPDTCDVAPMAEYYFAEQGIEAPRLVEHVRRIDRWVTAAD